MSAGDLFNVTVVVVARVPFTSVAEVQPAAMAPPRDKAGEPSVGGCRLGDLEMRCLRTSDCQYHHITKPASFITVPTSTMETLTISPHLFTMKPTHMTTHNNGYRNQQQQHRVMHAPSSSMVFSPRTSDIIHNPSRSELLCRYPSKLCDNIRSEKRGGGLHRFCAFHRERANINQRRVDHRRRLRRRGGHVSPIDRLHERDVVHSSDDEHEHHDHALAQEMISLDIDAFGFDACEPLCSALSEDDLQVLIQLLDEPHAPYNVSEQQHAITIKDEAKHEFR